MKLTMFVLVILLTSCRWVPVRADAVSAQCEPWAYEACKSVAGWTGDPEDAGTWDALADTLDASRTETRTCETRRKALQQCLERLAKAKLIVLP